MTATYFAVCVMDLIVKVTFESAYTRTWMLVVLFGVVKNRRVPVRKARVAEARC